MVFYRGLLRRDAFDRFTAAGKNFVGCCKTNTHFKVAYARRLPRKPPVGMSVVIRSDHRRLSLPERLQPGPSLLPIGPSKGEIERRGYLAHHQQPGGRKVMIYMTLIVASLVMAYMKTNDLKSYKIAKLKFEIERENDIIRSIVILCGGNPRRAALLWNSS